MNRGAVLDGRDLVSNDDEREEGEAAAAPVPSRYGLEPGHRRDLLDRQLTGLDRT